MTKKQFKESLLRGQGRCIQAVRKDASRYHDIVLWACRNTITFDAQSEGMCSWFIYQVISQYQDKAPFIEAIIGSLMSTRSNGAWKISYFSETLGYFAKDGIQEARQALWDKYHALYSVLLKRRQPIKTFFHELDDYEQLCLVLATNKSTFIKIAEDIGRLYQRPSLYDGGDFDWLHRSVGTRYLPALTAHVKKSADIARYLHVKLEYDKAQEEKRENYIQPKPESVFALSNWLKRKADAETIQNYAEIYLQETNAENRAQALSAFSLCAYPLEPSPVITDAASAYEPLKSAAWEALENIRHPLVRDFAMKHLYDNENALSIFIRNYKKSDADLLEKLVKSIPVDFQDSSGWHGTHLDVIRLGDAGVFAPVGLLLYILETSYCGKCREYVIKQLGKRKRLTNDILQESLFDSNEDIRKYAKKCLQRR